MPKYGINKVTLLGYVGKAPEFVEIRDGIQKASFPLATSLYKKNQDGSAGSDTDWHSVVVWGRNASLVRDYLKKGALIHIEGRIKNSSWDGEDGQRKYKSEVIAFQIIFLDSKGNHQGASPISNDQNQGADDLPF